MKTYSFAKISVMGMPTRLDVGNKYMFGGVSRIVNVSGQKYPNDVRAALEDRGIKIYEFPLVEEGPDMGIENILKDEYKSYPNHLIYNCSEGHLPSLKYLFEAGKRAISL